MMRARAILPLACAIAAPALSAQEPSPPGPGGARPVASMSELMVDVIYPTSDAIFYIATRTPTNGEEWWELETRALMLAESANLLMMPSRSLNREQWLRDAQLLLDVGEAAYRAAKARDVDALIELNDPLYVACVTCHTNFRPGYGRRP